MKERKPTIVHVNRQMIDRNRKDGGNRPTLIVRNGNETTYGSAVHFQGPCSLVYNNDSPLKCGARAWIETHDPVVVENAMTYKEALAHEENVP